MTTIPEDVKSEIGAEVARHRQDLIAAGVSGLELHLCVEEFKYMLVRDTVRRFQAA
jgi:hypothetical protein